MGSKNKSNKSKNAAVQQKDGIFVRFFRCIARNFKYFFHSMISNKQIFLNWRKGWGCTIIYTIIALSLIWIPPVWRNSTTHGSASMLSTVGLDTYMTQLVQPETTDDKGTKFQIGFDSSYVSEDGYFVASEKFKENATYSADNKDGLVLYTKTNTIKDDGSVEEKTETLHIYYFDLDPVNVKTDNENYQELINGIFKNENGEAITRFNVMYVTKSTLAISLFSSVNLTAESQPVALYQGYWNEMPRGQTFDKLVRGEKLDATQTQIVENWNHLLDLGYLPFQRSEMYMYLMMFMIGYVFLSFLAGVVVFVGSRKKNSDYRDMNFGGALSCGFTLNFTPGIIGFVVAFIGGNQFGFIAYVAAALIRTIFSLGKLGTRNKDEDAPLYQSRS